MDFEQLRIFMVLAEERTFLGAANRLATSRSRVRRKLDQLEADAGTRLLLRESSGLVLTPAGEALMRRGQALLDDARELIRHVRDVGTEPTGCLRVAMPIAPPPRGWDDICREIQRAHPRLRLDLRCASAPSALLPTEAEVALSFESSAPEGCRVLDLGETALRLVASQAYLDRHGAPAAVDDLTRHRLGVWRLPDRPVDQLPLRAGRALAVEPAIVGDDPMRIQAAVGRGDCIGYLPALPALDDPALKVLFVDTVGGEIQSRLFVPNVLADLPRVARFVELCAAAQQGA